MSAKRHVIVPRGFTAADLEHRFSSEKFHHMTRRQARALAQAGIIRQLGEKSGEIWQLTESCETALASPTGSGLLSREIGRSLRDVMRLEMANRPSPGELA